MSCLALARPQAAQAQTSIKLYVFDGGVLESDPARYRLTKEDVGTTQLSVAAYLIVHPQGRAAVGYRRGARRELDADREPVAAAARAARRPGAPCHRSLAAQRAVDRARLLAGAT